MNEMSLSDRAAGNSDSSTARKEQSSENNTGDTQTNSERNGSTVIKDLMETKEWLEHQLIEIKTQLYAAESSTPEISDPEILQEKISHLQATLQKTCTEASLRDLISSRLYYGDTVMKCLFNTMNEDNTASEEQQERNKAMAKLFYKQTMLAKQILQIQQENDKQLEKLNELKASNLELKERVRSVMRSLVNAKDNFQSAVLSKDEAFMAAKESLANTEGKIEVVRHVFQSLILGSGINWAEDPDITKVLLDLGRPLEDQISLN